jgi:hypothetical protein
VSSLRGLTAMIATEGFFWVLCNAHKRAQALRKIPLHGANTFDAPRQGRGKSRNNSVVFISVIGNPLKVGIQLSWATIVFTKTRISAGSRCIDPELLVTDTVVNEGRA